MNTPKKAAVATKPRFQKNFIIALYLGLAMVYLPFIIHYISYGRPSLWVIGEVIAAFVCILFLNKNIKVSIAALAVYVVLLLLTKRNPFVFLSNAEARYFRPSYSRLVEFVLAALALYGLNKGNRVISIVFSILFAAWNILLIFTNFHGYWCYDTPDTFYMFGALCEWIPPMVLLVCALWPLSIRFSILFLDAFMVVRVLLYVIGEIIALIYGARGGRYLNAIFLINLCWMPLMLLFGLNGVLLFPIPLRELAKVFGLTLFAMVYLAFLAIAQEGAQNAAQKAQERREAQLEEMKDNILSWSEAGFSEGFTMQMAENLLKEGRVTVDEYNWLVRNLIQSA